MKTNISYHPNPNQFCVATDGKSLYWIPFDEGHFIKKESDEFDRYLLGFVFNLQDTSRFPNASMDTIRIFFKKANTDYHITAFMQENMSVTKDYLIIPCSDRHRIFKKTTPSTYEEIVAFEATNTHLTQTFGLGNDKFLGAGLYNFHPKDDIAKFKLIVYDIPKKKIDQQFATNDYEGIEFTHLPNRLIDSRNKITAVASTLEYKILFYNDQLSLKDSIKKNVVDWKHFNKKTDPQKYGTYAKSLITDFLVIDDTVSRIEKIFFLNDSSLLVSYKSPGASKTDLRSIDVWQYKRSCSCWINIVSGQEMTFLRKPTDIVSKETFKPNLTVSTPVLFTDSMVIVITVGNDVPDEPMLVSDYRTMINKKYLDQEYYYSIFIYKWKLE
ncbi:MAG: hypothetical protein P0Y49_09165 [Candidatus Pedobacter colombiensis]|uniref:Uncharacterized protein n=1 Tax=Candidatus Pedobacter colombiensis TaxID=3121371 RepID=A0AAJ5WB96_9SPHI|nr:hypothetical protein [Pedobacter sp.]WEK21309.1 MAG: hypothetical protein P0Y49_09165 [Pedobacter sp.]